MWKKTTIIACLHFLKYSFSCYYESEINYDKVNGAEGKNTENFTK